MPSLPPTFPVPPTPISRLHRRLQSLQFPLPRWCSRGPAAMKRSLSLEVLDRDSCPAPNGAAPLLQAPFPGLGSATLKTNSFPLPNRLASHFSQWCSSQPWTPRHRLPFPPPPPSPRPGEPSAILSVSPATHSAPYCSSDLPQEWGLTQCGFCPKGHGPGCTAHEKARTSKVSLTQ